MNYRKKLGKQVDLRMELKKAWLCTELCLEKNTAAEWILHLVLQISIHPILLPALQRVDGVGYRPSTLISPSMLL